ncbi:MAG: hypothetical protein PR2021_0910 [Candidatus Phytoplasma pruni]|uniref:hypothetical protein n=1 Tax=Poinsettia branch-inducing phytoplasma TaxID=138647 RepID=UPI0012675024|nr:hypothetical protein [Poinsettia branch-inducing phytoplasma]WEK82165.1 MAG: hypothetical protein PR2021_0910 [Candidatus Phytoplasma pruni]
MRQRIAELKQQLEDEKKAHEETKNELLKKDNIIIEKEQKLAEKKHEFETLQNKWEKEKQEKQLMDTAEIIVGFVPGAAPALKVVQQARRMKNFLNWWN